MNLITEIIFQNSLRDNKVIISFVWSIKVVDMTLDKHYW